MGLHFNFTVIKQILSIHLISALLFCCSLMSLSWGKLTYSIQWVSNQLVQSSLRTFFIFWSIPLSCVFPLWRELLALLDSGPTSLVVLRHLVILSACYQRMCRNTQWTEGRVETELCLYQYTFRTKSINTCLSLVVKSRLLVSGPSVCRMVHPLWCLVDGRKEEDCPSPWHSTERFLCYFVWDGEEKSSCIVPLTAVTVKGKPGLKCPPLDGTKKAGAHQNASECSQAKFHGKCCIQSTALRPAEELFLKLRLPRISVRLSTEAMWQMINFSGRLEARGRGRGCFREKRRSRRGAKRTQHTSGNSSCSHTFFSKPYFEALV